MKIRFATALIVSLLVFPAIIYGQDCQNCKTRSLIFYDNQVTVPRPTVDTTSTNAATIATFVQWWNYFYIAGGVSDYLFNKDPTRDCITLLNGAFSYFTQPAGADTLNSIKFGQEHTNLPPSGQIAGNADYLTTGVITGTLATVNLITVTSREVVATASVPLSDGFNPITVGNSLGAALGPIYSKIMDFEKKKRDQGEPYAIYPKLTFTPAKTKLNSGDSTSVDVLFVDCDGVPLKGRTIPFEVTGGTTKPQSSVTTDDNGEATIEFTAGQVSMIACILSANYHFQRPTGASYNADETPGYIEVNKPSDSWYLSGTFTFSTDVNNHSSSSIGETDVTLTHNQRTVWFSALLKNMSLGLGTSSNYFMASPSNSQISYLGNASGWSFEHNVLSYKTVISESTVNGSTNATTSATSVPKLNLSVGTATYEFSLTNTADQTGGTTENDYSAVAAPGVQPTSSSTSTPAEATTPTDWSVQGFDKDTTISTTATSTISGGTETITTTIQQAVTWKDSVWTLSYTKIQDDNSLISASSPTLTSNENDFSRWKFSENLYLSKSGDPDAIRKNPGQQALLTQSDAGFVRVRANSMQPGATIAYRLRKASPTTLTVCNLLGKTISTIVDMNQPAGLHVVNWNATGLAGGLYLLRLKTNGIVETHIFPLAK